MRMLLHTKVRRATVTAADLNPVGSLTVDSNLLSAARLVDEHNHIREIRHRSLK